ncbi:MAG: ComEC/Rec2 family competence protein [Bacteroidales bacterium]|jgi:competence protein ComEC|nr:ComEC/Rec2 family competence protein [Bacteroidales bacterium]
MFEKFLHQAPFFRLVIALILGILFQINFPIINSSIIYITSSILFVTLLFAILKLTRNYAINKIWGVLVSLVLFFSGMQLVNINQQNTINFNNTKYTFVATLIEQPEEKEKVVKAIVKIDCIKDSVLWIRNNSKILCYFQKDSLTLNLNLGDQLIVQSHLNEIKHSGNPYSFNYKNYLSFKEIYNQCYVKADNFKIIAHDKGSIIRILSNRTRQKLLNIYQLNDISGDEFAVLSALTLGYKSELTPELKESFSASGAMHILAVSGLHVGIIFIILCKLLFPLQKNKYGKILQSIIIIAVLFFYAFLTGLSDSVLRATIMFSFISLGKMFTRQVNIYNTISASAFILLIINPYSIMNVGFQLSFAAVISIVFFQPKIYSLLSFKNKLPDYIWQLISVSIAAQIGTFPITIYYFEQFPAYFILTNILIIPTATLIVYGAILLFILSFSNLLSIYISKGLSFITFLLNSSVNFIEQLPYSKIDELNIDGSELTILIILIFSISFFIITKKLHFLKYSGWVLLGLMFYNISSNYLKSKKSILTVHNISGISAINIIEKNNTLFFCNKEMDLNEKNIKYNIAPLWQEYGIDEESIIPLQLCKSTNYFTFKNKRILQIKSNTINKYIPKEKINIDYIILSENININIIELNKYFEFEKLIFDSSNSFYKIKTWEKDCKKNNIAYYNVVDKGAFIEYL